MTKSKKDTDILFAYPKATNKKYIKKISEQTGQPMGHIIDKMVESFRLNKPFEVEARVSTKEKLAVKARKKKAFKAKTNERKAGS